MPMAIPAVNLSDNQLNRIFGQPNIMTRDTWKRVQMGRLVYEISYGKGLTGKGLWGVTIRDHAGNDDPDHSSQAFHSEDEAEQYIKTVRTALLLEP
jgi:hypothetical protein